MFLIKIVRQFEKHHIQYALVGGYAVALHGAVRGTVDLDFVIKISLKSFSATERALLEFGLESRLPVNGESIYRFLEEYKKQKNLVAWSFFDPKNPVHQVDIIITKDFSEIEVETLNLHTTKLKIISKKSLIEWKKLCARPQDLEDARALELLGKSDK